MINPLNYYVTRADLVKKATLKKDNWSGKVLQLEFSNNKEDYWNILRDFTGFIKANHLRWGILTEDEINEEIQYQILIYRQEYPTFFKEGLGWYNKLVLIAHFEKLGYSYNGFYYTNFLEWNLANAEKIKEIKEFLIYKKEKEREEALEKEKQLAIDEENHKLRWELERQAYLDSRIPIKEGQVFNKLSSILEALKLVPEMGELGLAATTLRFREKSKDWFTYEKIKTNRYLITSVKKDFTIFPNTLLQID